MLSGRHGEKPADCHPVWMERCSALQYFEDCFAHYRHYITKPTAASQSPTEEALLLAACEVGGTVAVYELTAGEKDQGGNQSGGSSSGTGGRGFAAALGLVGVFCGVVNCPLASLLLSIELFGSESLPLFALVCAISYLLSAESAPIKRIIQEARERGMLIDATYGRRTRAVIIMDTDHVILSAILPRMRRSLRPRSMTMRFCIPECASRHF